MKLHAILPALLVAFGMTAAPVPAATTPPPPPPPVAEFTDVDGNVDVIRAGKTLDAEEDMDLVQGDEIRTDAGATATITFLDHHFVRLGERTTLKLTKITSVPKTSTFFAKVTLATGKLFASFAKLTGTGSGFQVQTGSAVAAVKGTTFAVEAEGEASTISVTEGTVATSGMDAQGHEMAPVDVPEGNETSVDRRAAHPGRPHGIDARHGWVRDRLKEIHDHADEHRAMRDNGDLHRLRDLRRRAREGTLDTGADPEARAFLAAHPAFRDRLARHAQRHRRFQERHGKREDAREQRQEKREERRDERREKRR